MSLYQRPGSPFWQYSFTIDGVRFRGSTQCESRREAAQVEAEERHRAKNRRTRAQPWRLRDCLGAYWQEHAKYAVGADNIFNKLEALSRILGADMDISALTNADLLDYRAARRGEGLQAHSVNRDLAYLKAALNHASVMHGKQVPALAWRQIKAPEPPGRTRFLSKTEYQALIDASDDQLRLIVMAACATGLRKTNLLTLDWNQVDLSHGTITVLVKGNKRHVLRMPAPLVAVLARDTVRKGRVFDTTNFRKKWDKARETAKLEDFRFHDLRHTFASWARMEGADIADIRDALDHSSVAVTMRYAHIEPEHHTTAFDRVAGRVWSQSASHSKAKRKKS